jgi:hypothetical protein
MGVVLAHGRDFFTLGPWGWYGGVPSRRRYPGTVLPPSEIPARYLAEMREAWSALRGAILGAWNYPGRRPWAWWLFDSPEPRANDEPEADQLRRLALLKPDEAARLTEQERVMQ